MKSGLAGNTAILGLYDIALKNIVIHAISPSSIEETSTISET